eukprot:TRINITY_DN3951_c0_g1_i1.p1 TRINITY_DN3951_c0_g1~~TRINITY_DN3951_c0_g1_i1.p1  ORF type:complete len:134 (-),score=16.01 TRINITY_DN3951_c0_g1_i1:63-464(-)
MLRAGLPIAARNVARVRSIGVSQISNKRDGEFHSDDPLETRFGRIEIDPDCVDGLPFTHTAYYFDRPGQWSPDLVISFWVYIFQFFVIWAMMWLIPQNWTDMQAREEACRRRRLYRELQEWEILGEPDYDPRK